MVVSCFSAKIFNNNYKKEKGKVNRRNGVSMGLFILSIILCDPFFISRYNYSSRGRACASHFLSPKIYVSINVPCILFISLYTLYFEQICIDLHIVYFYCLYLTFCILLRHSNASGSTYIFFKQNKLHTFVSR